MAWRPHRYLILGELDNTERHRVTGWMQFQGLDDKVTFDLEGEFHRDIRGTTISLIGEFPDDVDAKEAVDYMRHFATHQTGRVGDITAGLPPRDYVSYPYIEWYSDQSGRVVLELDPEQLEVVGSPIPACESFPVSRADQDRNMLSYLQGMMEELGGTPDADKKRQEPPGPDVEGSTSDE